MSTFHALLESDVPVFSGIVDTKVATSRVQMSSVTDEASDPTPTALATQEYKACEGDVTLVAADRHLPQRIKHTPHPKYGPRNDEMVIIVIGEVSFEISKRRLETESQWFKNRFASAPDEVNPTIYNVVGLVPAVTPAHFALLLDLMNCFPSWDFSDYTHSDIYGICTRPSPSNFTYLIDGLC
ncbi:hypothetical protein BT96DRAFT_474095 [Gymnopus androsaceus JB14]|uniref:BTB domain-containing protein n=1 Tax=Gymnopus androsaceus JB14 TaxID=1447944 RepID=A0A6A4I1C9_9AGAR|nr:hypothetical protein BT96DRAFT_474095 [Gymnopus androsaceus JB14]